MEDIEDKAVELVEGGVHMFEVIKKLEVDVLDYLGLPDNAVNRKHARKRASEVYETAVEWLQ